MIQTSDSSRSYFGNNSTTVPYPVPFYFRDAEDLTVVWKEDTGAEYVGILSTDYTVTGAGNPDGGSITFTWAVPTTWRVSIVRNVPYTQLTSYEEGDAFPAKSHEWALDKLTMEVQQLARGQGDGSGGTSDSGTSFRLTDASGGIKSMVKVNESTVGLDGAGNAVLRTPEEMLGWLGQVGSAWPDTLARSLTKGAYAGQLGVQLDNMTVYIANSTTPGDWFPFLKGTGIVVTTNGVPSVKNNPAGDIVGTTASQTLLNKTLDAPNIVNPTGLTADDVGLGEVSNTPDMDKPISDQTAAALLLKEDKVNKGVSLGYPSLDASGKIPVAQIPDSVVGTNAYQGTWNAATNTPAIPAAATGNKGWFYSVSVAGTTNINGISSWAVGDQIISNGSVWQKIPSTATVTSVNTKTGAVVLVPSDIGLGNVSNTSDAAKNSAVATLTNKTINGANNTLTVRLANDVTGNLPIGNLNSGTGAAGNTWWCGDGTWKQPLGTGDISGPTGSVDGEVALFSGTTGKILRRFAGTAGYPKMTATGVISTIPKIGGADIDATVITAQTRQAATAGDDDFLVVTNTGLLRKVRSSQAGRLMPPGGIHGLEIWNGQTSAGESRQYDLSIHSGACRDSTDADDIVIPTKLVKKLNATWAPGTNAGGRGSDHPGDAASLEGSWHIWAIKNPTTGAGDVMFGRGPSITNDTYGISQPGTLPSGYTLFRRIGSLTYWGQWFGFWQYGDYFACSPVQIDLNNGAYPPNYTFYPFGSWIPWGMEWPVDISVRFYNNAAAAWLRFGSRVNGIAESFIFTSGANIQNAWRGYLRAGADGSFVAQTFTSGTSFVTIATYGWVDLRGKDSYRAYPPYFD